MSTLASDVSGPLLADGPMPGGTANRGLVHRVGNTVRRPVAPCRAATHALLAHLASVGFDGAPRVLAADATTETLTYLDGSAAVPPLPDGLLTDRALVSVAALLRRYHEAAASFDPAGYRWPRRVPARFTTGLVSHNDVHPANVIFRDGTARALIDFDLAGRAASSGISRQPPGTGPRCAMSATSPTPGRARRSGGSASCSRPMGCPSPSAVRSRTRSWTTTTGAAPSSPTRPAPATPASSTTGAASPES